ncbi:hypothetical protein GMB86_05520 [Terrilactibacillus sp. BCM23-1]|uniref:DUF5412 domain-containing protein n=1 Tax=Terrilactibacillus tamarindi TaxID=2599694 RepID=A0A6N8CPA1_9BACI|nr:DUF5412 family protein [Terrilactibacillus tamarindi]MTT31478.1 hypothetical protein [Terrilactibacillus tamarindi]
MKIVKRMLISIVIIVAIFMGGKYVLDLLFGSMCRNEIIQGVPSPDGEIVAYLFSRDCGATTSVSFQLSIMDEGDELPNQSGNTFVSDGKFTIEWVNEKNLRINYKESSRTFEKDTRVNGIKVEYVGE